MAKISVVLFVAVVVVLLLAACTQEETDYWDAILWGPDSSPLAEPTPTPVPLPADYKLPVLTCNWLGECELK